MEWHPHASREEGPFALLHLHHTPVKAANCTKCCIKFLSRVAIDLLLPFK